MNAYIFQCMFYAVRLLHPLLSGLTARIPLAQALLESNSFTSHVYNVTNNPFGMMAPAARNTTALNKGGTGFAQYRSVLDAIRDYMLYCEAFGLFNDGLLDVRLKAGKYAADPNYYVKITKIADGLGSQLVSPAELVGKGVAVAVGAVVVGSVIKKAVS